MEFVLFREARPFRAAPKVCKIQVFIVRHLLDCWGYLREYYRSLLSKALTIRAGMKPQLDASETEMCNIVPAPVIDMRPRNDRC